MSDPAFQNQTVQLDSPGGVAFTIAPGAGDIPLRPRGILVSVGGDVTMQFDDGLNANPPTYNTLTVTLAAGIVHPLRPIKITAATATGIVGFR